MELAELPKAICCGLSCMDIELRDCAVPVSRESVTAFHGTTSRAGGSAPQTANALAMLNVPVALLTAVGKDVRGRELVELCSTDSKVTVHAAQTTAPTAMAMLPLFVDGTRACFVDLGANLVADVDTLLPDSRLTLLASLRVFHFGYPHLMSRLQGAALRSLFDRVRDAAPDTTITLDINGASASEAAKPVLTDALPVVAAVHANLDEACVVSGLFDPQAVDKLGAEDVHALTRWFTSRGCAIALITCGRNGVFAKTGSNFATRTRLSINVEQNYFIYRRAFDIADGKKVNASGAGDAFCAGVIAELVDCKGDNGILRLAEAGLASALLRIDPAFSSQGKADVKSLLERLRERPRIQPGKNLGIDDNCDHPQ